MLEAAHHDDVYVTVRAAHDRRVQPDEPGDVRAYLRGTLRTEEPLGHFAIDVVGRPGRAPREASMAIRAREVVLETSDAWTKKQGSIPTWAVFAVEDGTNRDDEKPLE